MAATREIQKKLMLRFKILLRYWIPRTYLQSSPGEAVVTRSYCISHNNGKKNIERDHFNIADLLTLR